MYSRHCTGFLASSRFTQMRRASMLQVPHRVFIFLTPHSATLTPKTACHFSMSGGISSLICWLLGGFEVHSDAPGFDVASAPPGFHLLDAPLGDPNTQNRLPFLDERRNQFLDLLAIPLVQNPFALPGIGFWPHMKFELGLVAQLNAGCAIVFDYPQTIPSAQEIMALAADHLTRGLTGLWLKLRPLAFDPAECTDHLQPHRVVAHPERRGHAHATVRRIDAEVQILDALAEHLHPHTRSEEHTS